MISALLPKNQKLIPNKPKKIALCVASQKYSKKRVYKFINRKGGVKSDDGKTSIGFKGGGAKGVEIRHKFK